MYFQKSSSNGVYYVGEVILIQLVHPRAVNCSDRPALAYLCNNIWKIV